MGIYRSLAHCSATTPRLDNLPLLWYNVYVERISALNGIIRFSLKWKADDCTMINNSARNMLYEQFVKNNYINPKLYEKHIVKRGLRNSDGTGVIAGLTNICNVHGYIVDEGEKKPIEGQLIYRGYNIKDIISNAVKENRFGFEETVYLLLMGELPNSVELAAFSEIMAENRALPETFFEDMILKAPSKNIMNKMGRSMLALYSYDDDPENRSPEYEMATAISIISKLPNIMVSAYQVKKHAFDGESMVLHPLIPSHTTAQMILSALRLDREFTDEEAKLLDLMLIIHAEHGGGNNSTFSCRVLTSAGTDPYSAYAAVRTRVHVTAARISKSRRCRSVSRKTFPTGRTSRRSRLSCARYSTKRLTTVRDLSTVWDTRSIPFPIPVPLSSKPMRASWLRARSLNGNLICLKRSKSLLPDFLLK